MKLFAVLAILALAYAATTPSSYSGDINYGTAWNPPTIANANPPTCTPQAANADHFVRFNMTFAATTVVNIAAMFEKDFLSYAQVIVYTGIVDPTSAGFAPCGAAAVWFAHASSGAPPIFEGVTMSAGTFTFVVTGDGTTRTTSSRFAIRVSRADWTDTTANSVKNWTAPYSGSDCTYEDSETSRYLTKEWQAPKTEYMDFWVYFPAVGETETLALAIYKGVFPNTTTNVSDACDGDLIWASRSSSYDYAELANIAVTAGQNYTFVVSIVDEILVGTFGIFLRGTIHGDTSLRTATYEAPTIPALSTTPNCSDGGSLKKWEAWPFVATFPLYIVDTGRDSEYDTGSVLYLGYGNNTGAPSCANFVIAGDTGDGGPLVGYTIIGLNYTVIVTGWSSGSGEYSVWIVGGNGLALPPSTTGSAQSTTGAEEGSSSESGSPAGIILPFFALVAVLAIFF